jgi:uncharacterized membrane protein (DUF485 family)
MRSQPLTFLLLGLLAGVVCVLLGASHPVFLAYAVGPLVFAAVVAGIAISHARPYVRVGVWRLSSALLLSTITYLAALFAFSAVGGFSPNWFGVAASENVVDFGVDVLLGLLAAGIVAATGVSTLTVLLTGRWSAALLLRLILTSVITIVATFVTNLLFHSYWSFLGILLPLGSALFCWLVGGQIWLNTKAVNESKATGPAA